MAEETAEESGGGGEGGRNIIVRILFIVLPVLVAVIAGVLTYMFVLAPLFAKESVEDAPLVPVEATPVAFETRFVNVVMPDPDMPASTLIFQVTLECNNVATAELVALHMARFYDILIKLHSSLGREELNDNRAIMDSIQRQILQQSNETLTRILGKEDSEIRITSVFHEQFSVSDSL